VDSPRSRSTRTSTGVHLSGIMHQFINKLHELIEGRYETPEWIIPGTSEQSSSAHKARVVLSFILRLYHLLNAITLLSMEGMAAQAKIQVRTVVEMAIDLRYIASRPIELSSLYLLHEGATRYRDAPELLNDGVELSQEALKNVEMLKKMSKDYLALLSQIQNRQVGKAPSSWTVLSLVERAEQGSDYMNDNHRIYEMYKRLCISMHGEARSHKDYVRRVTGAISIRLGPSWHLEEYVLYLSMVAAALVISAAHKMGLPLQLSDFDFDLGLDKAAIENILKSDGAIEAFNH
jgi:hypothetical protein